MSGRVISAAAAKGKDNMDGQRFDNIARRLGGPLSRRFALKVAGGGAAAAVFAALGLESSVLAGQVGTENHCLVRGERCTKKKQCCGARRKSKEIVCKISPAGEGTRCCGQKNASCLDDNDCCDLYFCNQELKCKHV
jgi:hypothetical protein